MSHDASKHPARPALFAGDYPPPTETYEEASKVNETFWKEEWAERHRNANFENARNDREMMLRNAQSGPLAEQWGRVDGPLSPREEAQRLETAEEVRRARGGLPDSPEDMPVAATCMARFP